MEKIVSVPLVTVYKTMASKDELVGLKCLDVNNEETVYIKAVIGGGIWAGTDKDSEQDNGYYYNMRELNYIID